MAARRPASKIVWAAIGLGTLLIFASSFVRELRRERAERACGLGDLTACARRCSAGSAGACEEIRNRCARGEAPACELEKAAKDARPRRARW